MGDEKPFIDRWREQAEQSLGWGDSDQWGEYDFERLSEIIFDKTGTRLSTSTLKRVWGKVRYDSTPTIVTLNAFGRFLDYADWRAFKQHFDKKPVFPDRLSEPNIRTKKNKAVKYAALLIIPILIIVLTTHLSWFKPKADPPKEFPVRFSARIISDKLPNSVLFDYDATDYRSDSVYIQQSWDPKRSEKVSGEGKQHTSIYYVPGYFIAKLVVNGVIKKEQDIFIKSNDWMALYDTEPPSYLRKSSIFLQGALGVTDSVFTSLAKSDVWNNLWVYFYNVGGFNELDGDDFFFSSNLCNTSLPEQSSCRRASVEIIGTKSGITIPLCDRGCIADIKFFTGDHYIDGKDHDLSAFGCNFTHFQKLSCSVQNKILTITLNDKIIYTMPTEKSIGKIVGIRIGFEGAGQIKNVILGNSQHTTYNKQF